MINLPLPPSHPRAGHPHTDKAAVPSAYPPPPGAGSTTSSTLREGVVYSSVRDDAALPRRMKEWGWVAAAGLSLTLVILLSVFGVFAFRAAQTTDSTTLALDALPTPVDARGVQGEASIPNASTLGVDQMMLDDGRTIELIPWDGETRLTVLVMGLDRRPYETGLAYRTDTMLLISLDPADKSLGILSIPRDLYVDVPGYSALQRVNSALVLGELNCAGCGAELAMQTIQYNLGIRVHGYLAVDFEAVIALVDAVGGIDVQVPYDIADTEYPDMNDGYDPFFISAGLQHLDGMTALRYARTRHTDSDFGRARRQQQVILALRDKVLNADLLPSLIVQSPSLYRSLSRNMYTQFTLDEIIELALYMRDLPDENIRTGVIDENTVTDYLTPEGAAVLVPQRSQLAALMADVFGATYNE